MIVYQQNKKMLLLLFVVLCSLVISSSGENHHQLHQVVEVPLEDYVEEHKHHLRGGGATATRQLKKNTVNTVGTSQYPASAYHPYANGGVQGGGGKNKNSFKGVQQGVSGGVGGKNKKKGKDQKVVYTHFDVDHRYDEPSGTNSATVAYIPETVDTYKGFVPIHGGKNKNKNKNKNSFKSGKNKKSGVNYHYTNNLPYNAADRNYDNPNNVNGIYGIGETKPCVRFQDLSRMQLSNPYSARDCLVGQYPRGSGCCRSYWWLILDESGTAYPSVPCICNPWTRDPSSFAYTASQSTINVLPHNTDINENGHMIVTVPGNPSDNNTPSGSNGADTIDVGTVPAGDSDNNTSDPNDVDTIDLGTVDVDRDDEPTSGQNAYIPIAPSDPAFTGGGADPAAAAAAHIIGLPPSNGISRDENVCPDADGFMKCASTRDCYNQPTIAEAQTNICCHKTYCACNFYNNAATDCLPLD